MSTITRPASRPPRASRAVRPALLMAGIMLLAANMRVALTIVSPLMGSIRTDLGLGSAGVSALIGLPLLCFAIASPFVPRIAARIGIEATLSIALGALTVGIVLRSVPAAAGLWIGTALVGLSIACINVLLPALLKRDFPTRIGPLTGIYNGVQSCLAALGAAAAVPLASAPGFTWRTAIGTTAALALIALAFLLPQLRRNEPGEPEVTGELPVVAAGTAATTGTAVRPLWRSATAWQVTAFMGLQSTLFYSVLTWWPELEHEVGVSTAVAGLHMALIQALGVVASLVTGALLRRVNPRLITVVPGMVGAIGLLGQLAAPSAAIVWATCIGLACGGNIVAALALFGARTRTHLRAASLSGMAQSFGYLLAAAFPPVLGALHDASSGWTVPLLVLAAVCVGSVITGALASRERTID